jgi:hypothetical protein
MAFDFGGEKSSPFFVRVRFNSLNENSSLLIGKLGLLNAAFGLKQSFIQKYRKKELRKVQIKKIFETENKEKKILFACILFIYFFSLSSEARQAS